MPVDFDEIAVKAMLHDAVTGQPQAPANRAQAVRARIVRHRARTAAIIAANAGLVIALVVGIAAALGPGRRQVPASHPPRPSWALPWPDHRDGSVPQRVLDQAVLAWRHLAALATGQTGLAPVSGKIAWYAGQKAANGHMVAVVFETQTPSGPRLVAGKAVASEVMNGQPGWSDDSTPWVFYTVPAPRPVPWLVLSLYLSGVTRTPDSSPDDWVLVLASPRIQVVWYNLYGARGVFDTRGATTELIGGGGAMLEDGFGVFDVRQITARVVLTGLLSNRNVLPAPVPVGIPGSADSQIPQLEIPGPVTTPARFIMALEFTGQGTQGAYANSLVRGNLAIIARCFGEAPLRLRFRAPSRPSSLGTIPCDDRSHVLRTAVTIRRGRNLNDLLISTSQMTSYRIAIGVIN